MPPNMEKAIKTAEKFSGGRSKKTSNSSSLSRLVKCPLESPKKSSKMSPRAKKTCSQTDSKSSPRQKKTDKKTGDKKSEDQKNGNSKSSPRSKMSPRRKKDKKEESEKEESEKEESEKEETKKEDLEDLEDTPSATVQTKPLSDLFEKIISSIPDNEFQRRLRLLILRNHKRNEDRVIDVSGYEPGNYSSLKIIARPKTTRSTKRTHPVFPIVSSNEEKMSQVISELGPTYSKFSPKKMSAKKIQQFLKKD